MIRKSARARAYIHTLYLRDGFLLVVDHQAEFNLAGNPETFELHVPFNTVPFNREIIFLVLFSGMQTLWAYAIFSFSRARALFPCRRSQLFPSFKGTCNFLYLPFQCTGRHRRSSFFNQDTYIFNLHHGHTHAFAP